MAFLVVTIAAIFCAYRVMRAQRLLNVTIWLAVTSALISVLLYLLGAPEVAVIELSVGAGLVTVLFVFAFSITGEITFDELTLIPRPLAWLLAAGALALLSWFTLPVTHHPNTGEGVTFARILWEQRGLDVLAQMVLIFSGVMGLLGLLADRPLRADRRSPAEKMHTAHMASLPSLEDAQIEEARP